MFFKKHNSDTAEPAQQQSAPAVPLQPPAVKAAPVQHSVIGPDLKITGDLVSSGDIRVDGAVSGNITCRTLELGKAPVLESKVKAETVRICGVFSGEVEAKSVVLSKSARVDGKIYQERLEIELGAQFEGEVRPLAEARKPNKAEPEQTQGLVRVV